MGVLVTNRLVPVGPAPIRDRRQRAGVTFLCRYLPHRAVSFPRPSPHVAEAEKGKRGPIRVRVVPSIWSVAAEIDEARLVAVEFEPVPSKTLAQDIQDPFGIPGIRERHHGVVGEADKDTSPLEVWFHLILEPLIQHMMQENVR